MLGRDYAGTTANIGLRAVQPARIPNNQPNLGLVLAEGIQKYNQQKDKQAYIDALNGGNQDEINAAWANYDPQGYANHLEALKQAEIARQTHLEDQNFQRELQRERLQNAMDIAMLKNGDTATIKNVQAMMNAGFSEQEAWKLAAAGQNTSFDVSHLGEKGQEAYDKKMGETVADEAIAQRQMTTLKPKAENALKRARESIKDGTGLGQIGGIGWTTGQGGQNRANIKNAQAQINTAMRGLLKQLGVGSTELNSAVEAEAYRYMISPDMPIGQQAQVLDNFEQDYLNGDLQKDLAETYAKPSLKDVVQPKIQEGAVIEDANGNKMILRGGQWQPM